MPAAKVCRCRLIEVMHVMQSVTILLDISARKQQIRPGQPPHPWLSSHPQGKVNALSMAWNLTLPCLHAHHGVLILLVHVKTMEKHLMT